MGLAETTIRVLFAFNGFVLLLSIQTLLLNRIASTSWMPCVWLVTAWAVLLWVLYRESQLPVGLAPLAGHVVWVLSALGYIWLGTDPWLTNIHVYPLDFSNPPEFEQIVRVRLIWISIYVLLSTTVLAWLLRVVAGRRPDASQAQPYSRMNGLLLGSICLLMPLIAIVWINNRYSGQNAVVLPYFMTIDEIIMALFYLVWLLVAIEISRGNKMAFRVGIAETVSISLNSQSFF